MPDVVLGPATPADIEPATACFVDAFATDPLMTYFFGENPLGREEATRRFFSLLLRARVAMGMPTVMARRGTEILGGTMGYSTERTEWPEPLQREWDAFEQTSPEIPGRFEAYEAASVAAEPKAPYYYLGVIGVASAAKGTGLGGTLLRAFAQLSADDPASSGVYLETGNAPNVGFYERHGFVVRDAVPFGTDKLWCMFLDHGRGTPRGMS